MVAGARVSMAQGEQRRWQCQPMPAGKATQEELILIPDSNLDRLGAGYFSGTAGAREGTNRLQMLERNNGT